MTSWRDRLVRRPEAGAVLAALVALGLYLPSLQNGFTYDDRAVVVENRFITDPGNLPHLLSREYFRRAEEKSWRPLTTLSYFFDHLLWGKKPFGYHLTNVLLHAVAAALVVLVLVAWRAPPTVALLGGLLFAAHPVASAAVEAVAFRDDLLATLFVGAGLVTWRAGTKKDNPSATGLVLAPLFYAAGCLAKESAIVMPALALVMDGAVERHRLLTFERRRVVALGALAAVGLAYLGIRFGPMAGPEEAFRYLDASPRVAAITAPAVLLRATRLLVLPVGLSPVRWVEPIHSLAHPLVAAGLALLAAAVAFGLWARRRAPRAVGALVWMAVAWLPVSGIVPLTHPLADRYLYLPLVGFAWLVAEGVAALGRREDRVARAGAVANAAALLVAGSALTLARHPAWHDDLSLWRSAVANEPASYRAHYNLGNALDKAGRLDEAEDAYRRALALKPVFSLGHYSLGRLLYKTERVAEATEQLTAALADRPDYAEAHNHLGLIFAERGEADRARAEYELALSSDPSNANALNNLGILAANEGEFEEAEAFLRRATSVDPYDPKGFANLGTLLARRSRNREAEQAFRQALARDPTFGPARKGLAGLQRGDYAVQSQRRQAINLARAGRTDEAIALLRSALAERPRSTDLRHTLATTLLKASRYEEASKELHAIIEASPQDVLARRRLAYLERRAGRVAEALRHLEAALAVNPSDASLLTERGLTLGQAARLSEAEETLRRAIEVQPTYAPAHEGLGRVLLAAGRPTEAAAAFRRALELDPSLTRARRGLTEATRRTSSHRPAR